MKSQNSFTYYNFIIILVKIKTSCMKSLYEMYFKYKKINNLKIKEIPHENRKPKKAGVVILMLNKADFNAEENG